MSISFDPTDGLRVGPPGAHSPFPPTLVYNEGWLLRLTLEWFARHPSPTQPLCTPGGGRWYSEALLPSAFLPRFRGDSLGEAYTHADGVVGHFGIGAAGKGDLSLESAATHFVVVEAKLYSPLSAGVSHARYFDQAARTVACMAEVLRRAERDPADVRTLGFYLLAPADRVRQRLFNEVERACIRRKVERRVKEYQGERDAWLQEWFLPTWERCDISILTWEDALAYITRRDQAAGTALGEFYRCCLRYGGPSKETEPVSEAAPLA